MRIPNFNPILNSSNEHIYTWNAWKETYVKPLEYKINSLYDYIIYSFPDWEILNARDGDITTEDLEIAGYCDLSALLKYSTSSVSRPIYFVDKLDYKQGILNMGRDAIIVYQDASDEDTYHIYGSDYSLLHTSGNEYTASSSEVLSITNFPSGMVIFNNELNTGVNRRTNAERHNISNYMQIPLANGGFYTVTNGYNCIIFKYYENVPGVSFVDNFNFIFLTDSSRYCYYKSSTSSQFFTWDSSYSGYAFQSEDIKAHSKSGNNYYTYNWNGSNFIMNYLYYKTDTTTYDTGEDFAADVCYRVNTSASNYTLENNFYLLYRGSRTQYYMPSGVKINFM